jgi:TatA/E family protein of Tat protein translocase
MFMQIPVLLFFDISAGELIIILLVAFVVFGPSRIPEIARKIGRGINEVRRASDEIKREITKETRDMESSLSMDDLDLSGKKDTTRESANTKSGKEADQKEQLNNDNTKEESPPAQP